LEAEKGRFYPFGVSLVDDNVNRTKVGKEREKVPKQKMHFMELSLNVAYIPKGLQSAS
jgi:hypothetical protein